MIQLACIGGYGHTGMVLNDLASLRSELNCRGIYEVYPGEDFQGNISGHSLFEGAVRASLTELPDLFAEQLVGVAVIGTRLDLLAETAIAAAQKGWHLIVEKPLAFNREDLQRVHEAVQFHQRRIMPMLTMRNRPAFQRAKEIVESGAIGKVGLISVRKSYKWGERPAWFGDSATYPGTIPWVGIHALDISNFITGQRIGSISSEATNRFHPEFPACEDIGGFHFQCDNGVIGSASIDYLRPEHTSTHGDDWCRIAGEDGILEVNASTQTLHGLTASGELQEDFSGQGFLPIFSSFFQTLENGRQADEDIGFHLTEACIAANESQAAGRKISIDPTAWTFTG